MTTVQFWRGVLNHANAERNNTISADKQELSLFQFEIDVISHSDEKNVLHPDTSKSETKRVQWQRWSAVVCMRNKMLCQLSVSNTLTINKRVLSEFYRQQWLCCASCVYGLKKVLQSETDMPLLEIITPFAVEQYNLIRFLLNPLLLCTRFCQISFFTAIWRYSNAQHFVHEETTIILLFLFVLFSQSSCSISHCTNPLCTNERKNFFF